MGETIYSAKMFGKAMPELQKTPRKSFVLCKRIALVTVSTWCNYSIRIELLSQSYINNVSPIWDLAILSFKNNF